MSHDPSPQTSPALGAELVFFSLLTFALVCVAHFQGLVSPYAVNDDVRQQIYWMQAWRDPGLYANDWLTDYAQRYAPWGVKGVYRLAALAIDPLFFSKVLTCALMIGLGLCLHRIGETLADRRLGRAAVVVFWFSPFFLHNMSGGLARSFAGPLLALFLLGWLRRSARIVGASLVLQGLFIPYVFLLASTAIGLAWLATRLSKAPAPVFPARPIHYLVFGLAAGLTLFYNFELQGAGYGPMVTIADMSGRPEYGPQGRFTVFPAPSLLYEIAVRPFERFVALRPETALPGALGLALLGGALLFYARRADWAAFKRHAQPFLCLSLASLALYFAARLLAARLFIPSRYLEYTTALCYTLGLALCLAAAFKHLARRLSPPAAGLGLAALALLAGLGLKNISLFDYGDNAPLYAALRQTPTNSRVAGHPFLMDNVLTFGQRQVYISYELAHPWSKGLWARQSPMLRKLFAAYYAADPQIVRDFCALESIDFLVVDERHFTRAFLNNTGADGPLCEVLALPGPLRELCVALAPKLRVPYETPYTALFPDAPPFFEPFREQIRELTANAPRFTLLGDFPGRRISEHIRLIDTRALRASAVATPSQKDDPSLDPR